MPSGVYNETCLINYTYLIWKDVYKGNIKIRSESVNNKIKKKWPKQSSGEKSKCHDPFLAHIDIMDVTSSNAIYINNNYHLNYKKIESIRSSRIM